MHPRFTFADHSESSPALTEPRVSRGAAFGDLDNDGDTDIVVFNCNGPAQLLKNTAGDAATWCVIRLRGRTQRSAVGAIVALEGDDGRLLHRRMHRDGSYLCAHDDRVRFAVTSPRKHLVRVSWPSGQVERFDVTPGPVQTLVEGRGTAAVATRPNAPRPSPPQTPAVDVATARTPRALPGEFPIDSLSTRVRNQIESARQTVVHEPDNAAAHAALGMVLHTYELFNAASASYERAVALDDTHPEWLYYLALTASHSGAFDRAAHALDRILTHTPDNVATLLERGEVALRQADTTTAETMFRRALLHSAEPAATATALCGLGRTLERSGRHEEASKALGEAITLAPDYALAHYTLARIERERGTRAAAERHAELAVRYTGRRPEYTDPWIDALRDLAGGPIHALHEGIDLMQAGRFDSALPLLEQAARERNDLAEAHAHLGARLLKLGRQRALAALRNCRDARPTSYADAHYHRGVGIRQTGHPGDAARHFRQALAVRPDHFDARYGLALCLLDLGDRDAAAIELRRLIPLGPQDPRAPKTLARMLAEDRDDRAALDVLTAALARMPDDMTLRNRAAWLLATSGDETVRDGQRALAWATRICAHTNFSEPRAVDTLAAAQAETGAFEQAAVTVGKALSAARARGQQVYAEELARRQQLYRAGKPYRRPARHDD